MSEIITVRSNFHNLKKEISLFGAMTPEKYSKLIKKYGCKIEGCCCDFGIFREHNKILQQYDGIEGEWADTWGNI